MKKIRIELLPSASSKTYEVFNSIESLYFWLTKEEEIEPEEYSVVTLKPGEFIEAEWWGCEFDYSWGDPPIRYDFVRLALASPTSNGTGVVVSVHAGWVHHSMINFTSHSDEMSQTTLLHEPADWKLNLNAVFEEQNKGRQ